MKLILKIFIFFVFTVAFSSSVFTRTLQTRAEKTDYRETTRYAEVMSFLKQLQKKSADIRVTSIGKSAEGRNIPLVILGDPVPTSPSQLFVQNKPAIYIQANIHAGEVEGKEAVLMLIRDILMGDLHHLLNNQVLLITPIFNADGNEKISVKNRRNQVGPEGGVGVRHNGQNLDINRDYMKLETPENLGAVQVILNRWDPMLLIDLHTTNGSYHQEPLTYATAHNPNGDANLPRYIREKLFPTISKTLESTYNISSIPYGFFVDSLEPEKGWRTFNHLPHYSTNYWGLRNRFAILDENYSYADFKTRVHGCYHFVRLILEYTQEHGTEMLDLIRQADLNTIKRALSADTTARFGTAFKAIPFEKPLLIHSYEFEIYTDVRGKQRARKTDRLKNYEVPFYGDFIATRSVALPKGYFFPGSMQEIAEKLRQHGIAVDRLSEPCTVSVEKFQITNIENSDKIFQGHKWTKLQGNYQTVIKKFLAGTYFVGLNQPLANVAAYLLEPESDGGLVYWNFFDRYLRISQWRAGFNEFPVYRLMVPLNLAKDAN